MKYLLSIVFLLFVNFSFACECVAKPGINIKDLNDTDFIFTGILSQFEKVEGKIELTFQISNILKGRVNNKSIKFSIDKDKNHDDVFHHIDSIYKGQKWIIFSTIFQMNDKSIYKLKESNDTDYCMLSKPLVDNDSYLLFINETFKNSNNSIKTYTKKKVVFAKGSLKNKFPNGVWKYFTRNDLKHYWEGLYVNGKRDRVWKEYAINFKNEKVVIKKETYQKGLLIERIEYNYIEEIKRHEIYKRNIKKRTIYCKNTICSIWVFDKITNKTSIEYFRNGKSKNKVVKNGDLF